MNKKLIKCKTCGVEIATNAKTCPHCGAKNKQKHPIMGTILILFVIGLIGSSINSSAGKGGSSANHKTSSEFRATSSQTASQSSVPEELQPDLYKANCTEVFNYIDLQRNPSDYANLKMKTTLTVVQLVDSGFLDFSSYYRCYDAGDNEYVVLDARESSEPKIIKGDTITIYGEFKCVQEGMRMLTKEKVEIPTVSAKYIDILE